MDRLLPQTAPDIPRLPLWAVEWVCARAAPRRAQRHPSFTSNTFGARTVPRRAGPAPPHAACPPAERMLWAVEWVCDPRVRLADAP